MKKFPRIHLPEVNLKKLIRNMLICTLILLVLSGYLAYTRIYITPERRFWMAMENNLSIPSVVRTIENGGTGNKSIEATRIMLGVQAAQDKVSSVSLKNATTSSNVTTETITTPNDQYVRYTNIFSNEKKSDGTVYNFAPIMNVWADQGVATDASVLDSQRLNYAQPLITLAMFGNLNPTDRNKMMNELKTSGAYNIDFAHPTYTEQNGQRYIDFAVQVRTKKYVQVLQHFFTLAGYGTFPPLDPSGYPDNVHVNSHFLVSLKNNTLTAINFNDQIEAYSDYGVSSQVAIPKKTISVDQLQSMLQSAQ